MYKAIKDVEVGEIFIDSGIIFTKIGAAEAVSENKLWYLLDENRYVRVIGKLGGAVSMNKEKYGITTYSEIKVGEKFCTVASKKICVKTLDGAFNLTDNRKILLFPSSSVRRITK